MDGRTIRHAYIVVFLDIIPNASEINGCFNARLLQHFWIADAREL